jgi:hypothetical protein
MLLIYTLSNEWTGRNDGHLCGWPFAFPRGGRSMGRHVSLRGQPAGQPTNRTPHAPQLLPNSSPNGSPTASQQHPKSSRTASQQHLNSSSTTCPLHSACSPPAKRAKLHPFRAPSSLSAVKPAIVQEFRAGVAYGCRWAKKACRIAGILLRGGAVCGKTVSLQFFRSPVPVAPPGSFQLHPPHLRIHAIFSLHPHTFAPTPSPCFSPISPLTAGANPANASIAQPPRLVPPDRTDKHIKFRSNRSILPVNSFYSQRKSCIIFFIKNIHVLSNGTDRSTRRRVHPRFLHPKY